MRGNDIEAKACIEQAQFFPAGQVQRLCRLVNQMTDDGTGSAAFLIRWPHHNRRQFVRPSRCVFTCPQPINLPSGSTATTNRRQSRPIGLMRAVYTIRRISPASPCFAGRIMYCRSFPTPLPFKSRFYIYGILTRSGTALSGS